MRGGLPVILTEAKDQWWNPLVGLNADRPICSACSAAESSEPVVHGGVAEILVSVLPKPLGRLQARTAATQASSWARQISATLARRGSRTVTGSPEESHASTTSAGFPALGEKPVRTPALCRGV